jgi:hypothetical protein
MSRKQPRSKRINISVKEQWKQILKSVTKNEVPVNMLQSVTVNLIDGTSVDVDIQELLAEGHDPDDVRDMLNSRLDRMDALIKDVDFMISIDAVAKTVQPVTNEILKHFQ